MVVLAHLQGVAATFRVGRHHHRGPLYEALGRTHALTDIAPTDLTVAAALVRKAYSKRRRSRLWSKPVNLRTWGLVSDPIVMALNGTGLCRAQIWRSDTHARKQCEIWAQFQPNALSSLVCIKERKCLLLYNVLSISSLHSFCYDACTGRTQFSQYLSVYVAA